MKTKNQKLSMLIIGIAFSMAGMLASCSKSSSSAPKGPPPPSNPGGYDSANQIAGLVGYWSFNGNANGTAGMTGVSTNTTFGSGLLTGTQALQGSSPNGFVLDNTVGSSIKSMTSFSLAFWINSAQVTNGAQAIFNLVLDSASGGGWPYLDVDLEGYTATSDSLSAKLYMRNSAFNWSGQAFQVYLDTAVGKWTQVVFTFNGGNSTINAYENGVAAGFYNYPYGPSQSPAPKVTAGPITVYGNDPGAATGNPLAAPLWTANFSGASGIVFDDWQTSTSPNAAPAASSGPLGSWAVPYVGSLSHFRIYNTALNASDVNSLYILEKSGF